MKLNLGCGNKKLDGFLNVDSYEGTHPDKIMDLRKTPYPFDDNSISEIRMRNILEHLPQDPDQFFGVMQEIYRISQPNARILIRCPHPNHRWQIEDLTHQKAISAESFLLLSRSNCEKNLKADKSKSPLAFIYNIDFELVSYQLILDTNIKEHIIKVLGSYAEELLPSYLMLFNNVGATQEIELITIK